MFRKKRGAFREGGKRRERRTAGRERGGVWAKRIERTGGGGGFGEGEGDGGEGPGLRLAGAGGGGCRRGWRRCTAGRERESRRGEGGPQGAPAQPEPAAGGRRNRRRRFALRAVSPDGAAARNGLLRRKWQDWKVKGMFTSLYGKNVLQYIIGKLPEKITPPCAGSKEHRL